MQSSTSWPKYFSYRSGDTFQWFLRSLASLRARGVLIITSIAQHLTTCFYSKSLIIRSILRAHDQTSCLSLSIFEPSRTVDCLIILYRVPYSVYHFSSKEAANKSSADTQLQLEARNGHRNPFFSAKWCFINLDFYLDRWYVWLQLFSLSLFHPVDSSPLDRLLLFWLVADAVSVVSEGW